MRRKTSGNNFRAARKRGGFTLIELLIVVVIMAILVGVTGSLLAGFYDMFDATTDSATARRRANEVFNILEAPISNAGVGIPGTNLGDYFEVGAGSPLGDWALPVEVISDDSRVEGNALKIAYALPTRIKNGDEEIDNFSSNSTETIASATLTATSSFAGADLATRIVAGEPDVRAFITFPGADMRPTFVQSVIGNQLMLSGRPFIGVPKITDNIIHPYHEIYAVRAGVACVVADGASSSFYLLDVCTEDPLLPSGALDVPEAPGFRVEGIRGVSFDVDPQYRSVTVWVLAEGDVAHSGRNTDTAAAQRIRNRWEPLIEDTLNDQVYYEEFQKTWRTQSVQIR